MTLTKHRWAAVLLASLAAFASLGSNAAARDIYVSNVSGDDHLSGLEPKVRGKDGPVRTIRRGLEIALPSDHVLVANTGQPYRETIAISGSCLHGTARRPFVLQSDGAVIDGTITAAAGAWKPVEDDIFAFRPRRLTYQQLFKDGEPLPHVALASLAESKSLDPLHWSLAPDAVLLRVERDKLPRNYNLRHAGLQTGLTIYNAKHVVVDGFVIQGFQQDGVNVHELAKHCTLRNLECRANGRSGLSVGGLSRVAVVNSRFYDNGRTQVRTEGGSRLELTECDVDAGTATDFSNNGRSLTVDGQAVIKR